MEANRLLILLFILFFSFHGAFSSDDGILLLAFRRTITLDPSGFLSQWSEEQLEKHCIWPGVACSNGHRVTSLNLENLGLQGNLGSELTELSALTDLNLRGNEFSGSIPPEIGKLAKLRTLDLANNSLGGVIPEELYALFSLTHVVLSDNRLVGLLPAGGCRASLSSSCGICDLHRLQHLELSRNWLCGEVPSCLSENPRLGFEANCLHSAAKQRGQDECAPSHRILASKRGNSTRSSADRTKPQIHRKNNKQQRRQSFLSHHHFGIGLILALVVSAAVILIVLAISVFFYRRKTAAVIPWKSGMSGHLQKTFPTEVPLITWSELQAACEDFSNIIGSSRDSVVYKGTLSNGTEVAVTSITVPASSWTASAEVFFRRKVEALARMKHTHLVNLMGFCAEEDPFARMLLFEYVPNGTLFEHLHLHNSDVEHLDWPTRMRIIMGAAYGLEYMHHELLPPASHSNFDSAAIYLTEDYAAKLADYGTSRTGMIKSDRRKSFSNAIGYDDMEGSDRLAPDFENNILSFGLLLLEVVSGRKVYSEEGSLLQWASEFLTSPETVERIVDPALTSVDKDQLLLVCEAIRLCVNSDPSKRPRMKSIASVLSKGLSISAQAARPRTPSLLWAELEILSL